eukprot:GHVS01032174.1.p1 GENE.GHVS01032174.1~~GHVS01032174.1.p1  ORF type:complete len:619 (+),score=86.43 GHVS01032174.1:259-2115(+)
MQAIRRGSSCGLRRLPHRQSWHNLAAYKVTSRDNEAWKEMRQRDDQMVNCVNKHGAKPPKTIDWSYWEQTIGHNEIVTCLKSFYEQQLSVLNQVAKQDHTKHVETQKEGWELFNSAVSRCEHSVEASENLVANGARGLWVSYHNPPVTKVDDNEWLDSDRHWQAVVEKQFFYNPNASIAEEDLPQWKEALRDCSNFKMETFNARSDTPVLYQYMAQLPSFEYYDIHRRAFLEHMVYYLARTGESYRMFPECPPAKWLAHIEDLRYQFIAVAQRRRSALQLSEELRELPLDLQPTDADHHGDEFHLKLLNSEMKSFEQMAATLMGNYMFLCYPYIPVQTDTALYRVLARYAEDGGGKLYSIGDDVNALFYLPNKLKDMQHSPCPREAFHEIMDHCSLSGIRFNPGYATLLDIHSQLLKLRGQNCFYAPAESVCDAFMRKLQTDDPSYVIYQTYVDELKERFDGAVEVSGKNVLRSIQRVEENYRKECALFEQLQHAYDPEIMEEGVKEVNRLKALDEQGELQSLLNSGSIVAVTNTAAGVCRIMEKDLILDDILEYEQSKQLIVEAMKAEKLSVNLTDAASGLPAISGKGAVKFGSADLTGDRQDMKHLEANLRQCADK